MNWLRTLYHCLLARRLDAAIDAAARGLTARDRHRHPTAPNNVVHLPRRGNR